MMTWHPLSFVVVAVLSATGCSRLRPLETAPGPQRETAAPIPTAPRDLAMADVDKLHGTWQIESSIWNGVREPDAAKSVTILFKGDKFIVVDKEGNRQEETIKLMPDQNPKAIDCWSKGGGQAAPGIYSLEGDTFKWCAAGGSNKVRPTSFASERGSKQSLLVLRREKS
jgi:uncharacterized protein (TIGR03067 family)